MEIKKTYKTKIERFEKGLWSHHLIVPMDVYDALTLDGEKRVLCQINDFPDFHAGFMPTGDGRYFILLNKTKLKSFKLVHGQEVDVMVSKDNSKYGMAMPAEFQELLEQDIEGEKWFEQLTPGKQRNLIHLVSKVKSTDKRIVKALVIMDHLKANNGKIEFKLLNEAFKIGNNPYG